MTSNINEFSREVTNFSKVIAPQAVGLLVKTLAFTALDRLIKRTAVDVGRAKGGWQVALNTIREGETGAVDPGGAKALAAGKTVIGSAAPFDAVFMSNSVPYIMVLERGGYIPPNPENSPEANKRRAARRNARQRKRAGQLAAASGGSRKDTGAPLVRDGFPIQQPLGMVAVTFEEIRGDLPRLAAAINGGAR
jgi:hypothetical protein